MFYSALVSYVEAGNLAKAKALLASRGQLTFRERLIKAQVLALEGAEEEAATLANRVASTEREPSVAAEALILAGRIDFRHGNHVDGAQKFSSARQLSSETTDKLLKARVSSAHAEALLHFVGLQAAAAHFAELRRAVHAAGNRQELFELHLLLAEAEARLGRSHRAVRELELADANGCPADSPYNLARYRSVQGLVAAYQGELKDAFDSFSTAFRVATNCGAHVLADIIDANLGQIQVLCGRFDDALVTLNRVAQSARQSPQMILASEATRLQLARARGSVEEPNPRTFELANRHQGGANLYGITYRLEVVNYLTTNGRVADAEAIAAEALERLAGTADRELLIRAQLAATRALKRKPSDAWRLLGDAIHNKVVSAVDTKAAMSLLFGSLTTNAGHEATEHFSRAARLFGHIGHMVGRAEALQSAAALRAAIASPGAPPPPPPITDFYDKPASTFGRVDVPSDSTPATRPAAIAASIRAASSMIDLMSRPALAGYELLDMIAASEAATTSVLLSRKGESTEVIAWTGSDDADGTLRRAPADAVTLSLGQERGRDVMVVVRPSNQEGARTTLLAMQRLLLNGLALHNAAVAESEKSAIWPEPLPEQQLGVIAVSESMLNLLRVTRRVGASAITVLVTGETGTGKELLAHALHNCSPRAKGRFLPFNCTAVPREMLDSQLFGYRRGAFTGAHDAFPGVIRSAAGGTLFLDEIGELGLDVQPKLLRFLESGDVHPLGEPAPQRVDVRIVAATNVNLDRAVKDGRFREDLYYRLNVVTLTIPPLRERREEIPLLLDHFLQRSQKEGSKSGIRIGETAAEYLLLYDWPGNVRELANEMRRVVALAESDAIVMPEHLSPRIADSRRTVPVGQRPPTPTELLVRRDQPLSAAVEHVERALIMDALRRFGNVEDAARSLGLSRKGLYLKRQRLKIDEV
ncbi:MAG: sigma 54-interacting transcriptional regulator [Vicinamibacterales bacterium]